MKGYPNAHEVVWCQEEPQNQGAWYETAHYFSENMRGDQKLDYAGRPPSASPAGGYLTKHNARQAALVEHGVRQVQVTIQASARRVARWFFVNSGEV